MRIRRGLTPRQEKRKDAEHARRQLRKFQAHAAHASRPPHTQYDFMTKSGVPYFDNSQEMVGELVTKVNPPRRKYLMYGYSRSRNAKSIRKGNGVKEFGNLWWEEFTKPDIQGKSSRIAQKQKQQWWEEAYEALTEAA